MTYYSYDSITRTIEKLLVKKGYRYLACGTSRVVYLSPNGRTVVKVPTHIMQSDCNEEEYNAYIEGEVPIARCRIVYYESIPLIIMEYVTPSEHLCMMDPDLPQEWIKYDGGQCGHTRKGKLVLYDMGDSNRYA